MKKAVVTYNFGGYETMPTPLWKSDAWDLLAFTDEKTEINSEWSKIVIPKAQDIAHITDFDLQSKRLANYVKFQPFKLLREAVGDYDMIIVIDANFQLSGDLDEACERLLMATADGCFMSHPTINNAYDDIDLSVKLGKIDKQVADFSKEMMEKSNVPKFDPHYMQTGFSIRRHTSGWAHFEHIWWDSYNQMCNRDQPVFNSLSNRFPVLDLNVVPKSEIDSYLKYEKHSFEEVA